MAPSVTLLLPSPSKLRRHGAASNVPALMNTPPVNVLIAVLPEARPSVPAPVLVRPLEPIITVLMIPVIPGATSTMPVAISRLVPPVTVTAPSSKRMLFAT